LKITYENKKIYIAHGDFDGPFFYRLYTKLIRSQITVTLLNAIDSLFNHLIWKKLDLYLSKKNDCNEFENFENFVIKHIKNYNNCDYFIEGHYHQNKMVTYNNLIYMNLAAFACNQRYFIVKSSKHKEILEENIFSKGT